MEKKNQIQFKTITSNQNITQNINIPNLNNEILKNNYTSPQKFKDERPS